MDHPATLALRAGSLSELRWQLAQRTDAYELIDDDRDVMVDLAPFHDAAARLGAKPLDVFADVAASASPRVSELLHRFGRRTDVNLHVFGWLLYDAPNGPEYRIDPSPTLDGIDDVIDRFRERYGIE